MSVAESVNITVFPTFRKIAEGNFHIAFAQSASQRRFLPIGIQSLGNPVEASDIVVSHLTGRNRFVFVFFSDGQKLSFEIMENPTDVLVLPCHITSHCNDNDQTQLDVCCFVSVYNHNTGGDVCLYPIRLPFEPINTDMLFVDGPQWVMDRVFAANR